MAKRRGNSEGTIAYNDERKRWEGRLTVGWEDGRQVRRKVTGPTRAAVVKRLRELRDATDAGRAPVRRDLSVSRFLDTWVNDVLPGSVAPATERQYRDVIRLYIKPAIGRKHVSTLAAVDVTLMLRAMEAKRLSPNTRRLARSVLRRALRYAEQEGYVSRNVAAIAHGVRLRSTEGRTLTPEQARQLLASVRGDRLEAAYTVALALGLRRGELLGLTWNDLALDATPPRLTVRRTLQRVQGVGLTVEDTKTARSRRTLYLPGPAVDALEAHRERQKAERANAGPLWVARPLGLDLVFRSPAGAPVDPMNFTHATYRATEAAGLGRWSPHELRHSAASLLIAQGVPLKVVSDTLGHASIRVTADVYGHLLEPAKAEAADAMSEALWPT
jgi:integrase